MMFGCRLSSDGLLYLVHCKSNKKKEYVYNFLIFSVIEMSKIFFFWNILFLRKIGP